MTSARVHYKCVEEYSLVERHK